MHDKINKLSYRSEAGLG